MALHTRLAVAVAATVGLASAASAQIFYNNFNGTDSYSGSGWTISGGTTVSYFEAAFGFTSAASGQLGSITMSLFQVTGVNAYKVMLWTDSAGLPGTMLGSWNLSNIGSFGAPATVINTPGGPTLTAGTKYWLSAQASDPSTWGAWYQTTTGASSTRGFKNASTAPWTNGGVGTEGGMRLQGVPEPVSCITLSAGALALLRRRKKA